MIVVVVGLAAAVAFLDGLELHILRPQGRWATHIKMPRKVLAVDRHITLPATPLLLHVAPGRAAVLLDPRGGVDGHATAGRGDGRDPAARREGHRRARGTRRRPGPRPQRLHLLLREGEGRGQTERRVRRGVLRLRLRSVVAHLAGADVDEVGYFSTAIRVVAELHPFRRSVRELVPRGGGRRGVLLQPLRQALDLDALRLVQVLLDRPPAEGGDHAAHVLHRPLLLLAHLSLGRHRVAEALVRRHDLAHVLAGHQRHGVVLRIVRRRRGGGLGRLDPPTLCEPPEDVEVEHAAEAQRQHAATRLFHDPAQAQEGEQEERVRQVHGRQQQPSVALDGRRPRRPVRAHHASERGTEQEQDLRLRILRPRHGDVQAKDGGRNSEQQAHDGPCGPRRSIVDEHVTEDEVA
mmetsp:Transcript_93820/g.262497  ORF Transcript_93820/g.262497 Transcript_93820/m.262497 type:complete len:407 (+) Transcript_93820:1729-2949(+)